MNCKSVLRNGLNRVRVRSEERGSPVLLRGFSLFQKLDENRFPNVVFVM